jgi:hypothetical protein
MRDPCTVGIRAVAGERRCVRPMTTRGERPPCHDPWISTKVSLITFSFWVVFIVEVL